MFKYLIPAAALLATGFAPAHAQSSREVHFADLDLGSPAGQRALESRLRSAVRVVCATPNPTDLKQMSETRRCRRVASAGAKLAVDRAIVRYQAQTERLAARR